LPLFGFLREEPVAVRNERRVGQTGRSDFDFDVRMLELIA
jgi:hypothetical protein